MPPTRHETGTLPSQILAGAMRRDARADLPDSPDLPDSIVRLAAALEQDRRSQQAIALGFLPALLGALAVVAGWIWLKNSLTLLAALVSLASVAFALSYGVWRRRAIKAARSRRSSDPVVLSLVTIAVVLLGISPAIWPILTGEPLSAASASSFLLSRPKVDQQYADGAPSPEAPAAGADQPAGFPPTSAQSAEPASPAPASPAPASPASVFAGLWSSNTGTVARTIVTGQEVIASIVKPNATAIGLGVVTGDLALKATIAGRAMTGSGMQFFAPALRSCVGGRAREIPLTGRMSTDGNQIVIAEDVISLDRQTCRKGPARRMSAVWTRMPDGSGRGARSPPGLSPPPAAPQHLAGVPLSAQQGTAAFQEGVAARQAWEGWIGELTGDYRQGALYWAAQRGLPEAGSCDDPPGALRGDWTVGCLAAQLRVAPSDARRKTDAEFRKGWDASPALARPVQAQRADN
ncbi:MAG TPA: hypothetical protein VNF99_06685 [Stellaceae bacterium]|nr:hypothetical protein [Stellaceae bacterium]